MSTLPVILKLSGMKAVIVGAGTVGLRRAQRLCLAGAQVTLIDPRAKRSAVPDRTKVITESYRSEMLDNAKLVFACTDDATFNARVATDARNRGIWVNVADQPDDCDFYMPAVFEDPPVQISVSTGGAAPALSGLIKRRFAESSPPRIGEFAGAIERLRDHVRTRFSDSETRMALIRQLVSWETYDAFIEQGDSALQRRLEHLIDQHERTSGSS